MKMKKEKKEDASASQMRYLSKLRRNLRKKPKVNADEDKEQCKKKTIRKQHGKHVSQDASRTNNAMLWTSIKKLEKDACIILISFR